MTQYKVFKEGVFQNTVISTPASIDEYCKALGFDRAEEVVEEVVPQVPQEDINTANIDYLSMMTGVDLPSAPRTLSVSHQFEKVKSYYSSGLWTAEMVQNASGKWLTEEEVQIILEGVK